MEKPSAYLVGKCECLAKVVDFFLSNNGGYHRSVKDKRTVFLAQIDFWDWEMDELCYSVDSFTERSKAWESCANMRESLGRLGIPVDPSIVYKIESDRGWNTYFIGKNQVVPPTDALNLVIKKWNKLLKVCEDTLLMERKEILIYNTIGGQWTCQRGAEVLCEDGVWRASGGTYARKYSENLVDAFWQGMGWGREVHYNDTMQDDLEEKCEPV